MDWCHCSPFILKSCEQEHVWMGGLRALCWMVGYVIENHQEALQQCGNKLVCIIISSGNPRLDLFHWFTAPGPYTGYVNPARSPSIVPVFAEDTILFPANAIPRFITKAPHHSTSVVSLLTEEEKLERARYYRQKILEQVPIYDWSEILRRLARVEAVILESLSY